MGSCYIGIHKSAHKGQTLKDRIFVDNTMHLTRATKTCALNLQSSAQEQQDEEFFISYVIGVICYWDVLQMLKKHKKDISTIKVHWATYT